MHSHTLGTGKVRRLMFTLGWPSALNFLVITIYNLTDVVFVGRWLGSLQIAAVVVVGTITAIFVSFGIAIGTGGSSIIARALGEGDKRKAAAVIATQSILVIGLNFLIVVIGWFFESSILKLFGANGNIYPYASEYYRILLFGIPFLSMSTMGNSVIHTQGKAKVAMFNSLLPTVVNIILNPIFIKVFDMGIDGAAWATLIGYVMGFLLVLRFLFGKDTEVKLRRSALKFRTGLAREISQIGGTVLVNVVITNMFIILVNQVLYKYNQETGIVVFAILSRLNILFTIPVFSIDSGVRPIVGYNFGSQRMDRVRETIGVAIKYGAAISFSLMMIVFISADYLVHVFTSDPTIISEAPPAMRIVFLCSAFFMMQAIAEAYFQAIGKPKISFYLIVLRNVILLIPLLFILSHFFGYLGILYTFPVVDLLSTIPALWLLKNDLNFKLPQRSVPELTVTKI